MERRLGHRYKPTRAEIEDEQGNLLHHINRRIESQYAMSDWLEEAVAAGLDSSG